MSRGIKVFVTALLLLCIASLFVPLLMPSIEKDVDTHTNTAVSPLYTLIGLATDPATIWVRLLLLLPLGFLWFVVCKT